MSLIIQVDHGDGNTSSYRADGNGEGDGVIVTLDANDRNWTEVAAGREIAHIRCPDEHLDNAPLHVVLTDENFINNQTDIEELVLSGSQMENLYLALTAYYSEKQPDQRIRKFKEVL